ASFAMVLQTTGVDQSLPARPGNRRCPPGILDRIADAFNPARKIRFDHELGPLRVAESVGMRYTVTRTKNPTRDLSPRRKAGFDHRRHGGLAMGYDKHQATEEFVRWSDSYDRCILQWLIFGPSHRVLIRRIRAVAGAQPAKILDA